MAAALAFFIAILASYPLNCVAASDPAQNWALAAEQGNAAALARLYAAINQHDLAAENWYGMYCLNRGDDAGAEQWFSVAAQHGDAGAQFNLANLYANGLVTPHGAAQAVYWYRKAAEQGYAPAQRSLGERYLNGDGVARDPARGRRWLQRAAAAGDRGAAQALPAASAAPTTPPGANGSTATHAPAHASTRASTAAQAPTSPPSSTTALQAGTAGSLAAAPAAKPASPAAVAAAVRAWADAWSHKDLADYFDAYLPNYAPPGMSHAAWIGQRRSRIANKASIDVLLAQLRIHVDGDSATVSFIEHFRAGTLHFVGAKTLRLRLVGGNWLIAAES